MASAVHASAAARCSHAIQEIRHMLHAMLLIKVRNILQTCEKMMRRLVAGVFPILLFRHCAAVEQSVSMESRQTSISKNT